MLIIKRHWNIRSFLAVEHEGYRYFGVVQNGMQIGALALTQGGKYVQVNGSVVQPLDVHQVYCALKRYPAERDENHSRNRSDGKTVVTYRKRRRIVQDGT